MEGHDCAYKLCLCLLWKVCGLWECFFTPCRIMTSVTPREPELWKNYTPTENNNTSQILSINLKFLSHKMGAIIDNDNTLFSEIYYTLGLLTICVNKQNTLLVWFGEFYSQNCWFYSWELLPTLFDNSW